MSKEINNSHSIFLEQNQSTVWIENLALEELNMEESGIINFNDHIDPLVFLENASIDFMNDIRERFEFFINKFNFYRGNRVPGAGIKLFKISNTVNDFMLFRNSLKLIVARRSADLITVGLLSNSAGPFAARTSQDNSLINSNHEIKAHVGPFNEITWRYQGEIVNVHALTKHYLTEFIKHSAR